MPKTVNVLVVEDERKMASFLRRGLQEEGYTVDVVEDGRAAAMLRACKVRGDPTAVSAMTPRHRHGRWPI